MQKTSKSGYQDPRWQKVRLRIMSRDKFICRSCGDADSTLHVHHKAYEKGKKIWEVDDCDLVTLCATCHENTEHIVKGFRSISDDICFLQNFGICDFDLLDLMRDVVSIAKEKPKWGNLALYLLKTSMSKMITASPEFDTNEP